MKISFATKQPKADALVVGVFANRVLSNTAAEIDKACKGALRRAMRDNSSAMRGRADMMPQNVRFGSRLCEN